MKKLAVLDHAHRAHSAIGASQAERWMNCPGSVALCETVPKREGGPAAERGTANHEAAEYCLNRNLDAKACIGMHFNKKKHPNKFNKEDAEAVQVYLDHVRETLAHYKKLGYSPELLIEKKFHLKHIHENLYGTSDVVIRIPFFKIIVMDYKNGVKPVEVDDNPQLKIYGLGGSYGDDYGTIELHIVQPNAAHDDGPVRIFVMEYEDLLLWQKDLKEHIRMTEVKNAPLKTGIHCEYCSAAPVCPAMRKEVMATAKTDFASPSLPAIEQLTDDQLAKIMKMKKPIENWLKAVKDYALQRIIKGEDFADLKLVKGRGSKKWNDEEKVKQRFGKAIMKEPKIMSVAEAEKLIGKEKIKGLFTQYEGSVTVAHKTDKRKAIANAKDDFAAIEWEIENEDF